MANRRSKEMKNCKKMEKLKKQRKRKIAKKVVKLPLFVQIRTGVMKAHLALKSMSRKKGKKNPSGNKFQTNSM